jgi:hypothetical protein
MVRAINQETSHRHGYHRVSLKEQEEPLLKRANQVAEASTRVAARWREMETAGNRIRWGLQTGLKVVRGIRSIISYRFFDSTLFSGKQMLI